MVIVDTSAWIAALRDRQSIERTAVDSLLAEDRIAMVGPVLAELLRGARSESEFRWLSERLGAIPYLNATRQIWLEAGMLSYSLKRQGVTIHLVDALIATIAIDGDHDLYAIDGDFRRIPRLRLYEPAV